MAKAISPCRLARERRGAARGPRRRHGHSHFCPAAGSLEGRADLHPCRYYHKGEEIVKLQVRAGDHLFVDRVTYNFRPPERGEIIVFETRGIMRLTEDQRDTFYIKRLVGLSGETLELKKDYDVLGVPWAPPDRVVPVGHLVVDGKPLSATTPQFENLYSFDGARPGAKALQFKE